jgi:hypothetical protein
MMRHIPAPAEKPNKNMGLFVNHPQLCGEELEIHGFVPIYISVIKFAAHMKVTFSCQPKSLECIFNVCPKASAVL